MGRERAVPGDKNPPARWCSGAIDPGRSQRWLSAVSDRLRAYPALLLVRWRLCAVTGRCQTEEESMRSAGQHSFAER